MPASSGRSRRASVRAASSSRSRRACSAGRRPSPAARPRRRWAWPCTSSSPSPSPSSTTRRARYAEALWRRPWTFGALYGVAVFGVMHYIVVPLSAAGGGGVAPFDLLWDGLSLVVHAFGIGVPVALAARAALRGASRRSASGRLGVRRASLIADRLGLRSAAGACRPAVNYRHGRGQPGGRAVSRRARSLRDGSPLPPGGASSGASGRDSEAARGARRRVASRTTGRPGG